MRNNFEATAAHLLPYDPVAKEEIKWIQENLNPNIITNGSV